MAASDRIAGSDGNTKQAGVVLEEIKGPVAAPAPSPAVRDGQTPKPTVYRDNLLELAHLETAQLMQQVDSQVTAGQFTVLSLG